MSCVYKGEIINSELSENAIGGTEMMRQRLVDNADPKLLSKFAIHLSRPRELYEDVENIFWCHDLVEDPENKILENGGWEKFYHFVFVSAWQRDQYIMRYGIPHSECSVIYNAIEKNYAPRRKDTTTIRFVYHTTPHRGLELLVPIFEALSNEYSNIHLDVFSSFSVYGWESRDEEYRDLFDRISNHAQMTYHGAVSNEVVLRALDDSHVFLYPNIWKETSCISLIEAIKSQVICVHPNYGALPETGANATIMYDFNEDPNLHANYAFSVGKQLIDTINSDPEYFTKFTTSDRFNLARNNVASFKTLWDALLRNLSEGQIEHE